MPKIAPNLTAYSNNARNNEINIIAIMAQFEYEEVNNPKTTGRGHFLTESADTYIDFYDYN